MLPVMEIVMPQQGISSGSSSVPAFLAKLWKMVDDPSTDQLIGWSPEGTSFIIHNQAEFSQSLLPYYYKHNNMASFVRQLNMYGFHKVVGVDSGGLKSERQEEMEFAHQFFIKGMEPLLERIKRKVSTSKAAQFAPAMKTERVNEVLNEVSLIRDKQEDLDSKIDTMKKENEALWREVVNLRQKHQAQQKIVNKLIQFLVSIVQPRMSNAVKRRYPTQLAIEDTQEGASKEPRLDQIGQLDLGPIISDVTHMNDVPTAPVNSLLSHNSPDNIQMPETPETTTPPTTMRPTTPVTTMRAVNPSLINPSIASNVQRKQASNVSPAKTQQQQQPIIISKVSPSRPAFKREISKEDFDMETTSLQKDLDNLKDILSGQITLDSNFITTLFSPEDSLPNLLFPNSSNSGANPSTSNSFQMTVPSSSGGDGGTLAVLNETPSLFELADIDENSLTPPEIPVSLAEPTTPPNSNGNFDDVTLNTPLVYTDQMNPLTRQFQK